MECRDVFFAVSASMAFGVLMLGINASNEEKFAGYRRSCETTFRNRM